MKRGFSKKGSSLRSPIPRTARFAAVVTSVLIFPAAWAVVLPSDTELPVVLNSIQAASGCDPNTLTGKRMASSMLFEDAAGSRAWMAWREEDTLALRIFETTGGSFVSVPVLEAESIQPPVLVAQGPSMTDAAVPAPAVEEVPVPEVNTSPAQTLADLNVQEAARKIAGQIGVDASQMIVHPFATFAVVEHPASGRNWVLAKSAANKDGWMLASSTSSVPTAGSAAPGSAAPAQPLPTGAEISVVEVAADGSASEPTLLADMGAAGQVAEMPESVPYIGARMEPDIYSGPAVTTSGFLQFGTTYHSNVFLTDDDVDFDLVTHSDTDTGISDVIFGPAFGLRLDLNPRLAANTYFEYVGAMDVYASETGENRWRHSLEFNTRGESGELIDLWWRGGVIFHDQMKQEEAEYLAQDFMEFWVTPGLDFFLTDRDTLSLSTPLFYRNVSEDGLPSKRLGPPPAPGGGELPPAEGGIAPKTDIERYADHVGFGVDGTWRRRFSECLETRLRVSYLRRQYDRPALNEYGAIYGCDGAGCQKEIFGDRADDLFETSIGYTYAFCPQTAIGMSYRFRHNASNGDFYDYTEHGMRVVANHTLFLGRWCEANLRLIGDVAWRDWGARKADEWDTLLLPPVAGPDGLLTPGYDEDTRKDLTYTARVGFDREFGCYTIGTYYQFELNNSNDGSGDYQDHGVGGFVRMEY